jgi:hypothetical protein
MFPDACACVPLAVVWATAGEELSARAAARYRRPTPQSLIALL